MAEQDNKKIKLIGGLLAIGVLMMALSQAGSVIPGPGPGPGPGPKPDAPFVTDRARVLIAYESKDVGKYTRDQLAAIRSEPLKKWMANQGIEFRRLDEDSDMSREAQAWQDAMAVSRGSLPWIVGSDGMTGFSERLENSDQVRQLVEAFDK